MVYSPYEINFSLFDSPPQPNKSPHFDGPEYDTESDESRLTGQLNRIWFVMNDHQWRTVDWIAVHTGYPANSIQAQLRNLRKPRHGSYLVEKRRVTESGLYEYRVGAKGAGQPVKASCANCARLEQTVICLQAQIEKFGGWG